MLSDRSVLTLPHRREPFTDGPVQIPTILADNGGYDSSDLVTKLRAAHYEGQTDAGLGEPFVASLLAGTPCSLLTVQIWRPALLLQCASWASRNRSN